MPEQHFARSGVRPGSHRHPVVAWLAVAGIVVGALLAVILIIMIVGLITG